ncbi:inner envelope membrane protein [Monoraphidium neglectum]|uniref:Inner envelope membrane protein n=1 Tax=Monoraphidium neglectum TaxID=145388 RepID=A0A0D2J7G6_9CHLO|nr:inner envelope membrane protein [Monoraphidium neglectum]KIY95717.1 inner envelope membrane protein [Monoraphidium neglectum]|eukprot:XP_013894737.1 inner envelope membrane protein [Monoraphidium neglectum]
MLFPTEEEYIDWFTKAGEITGDGSSSSGGFDDVKIKRIGPSWYRGVRRHGLIMGCSVTGVKREAGESPLQLGPPKEVSSPTPQNPIVFLLRMLLGVAAGFYYFVLPVYMYLKPAQAMPDPPRLAPIPLPAHVPDALDPSQHLVWPKSWKM